MDMHTARIAARRFGVAAFVFFAVKGLVWLGLLAAGMMALGT